MATTTFTFNRSDFTSNSPSWGSSDEYSSGLRFNTVTKTLKLNNTDYGRGVFQLSIPSGVDFGSIHFNTPNESIVSVSDEINGLYELCNYEGNILTKKFTEDGSPSSGTKTYYVIYNGDPERVTEYLNISIALAKNRSIPSNDISITLTYTCLESVLYEYTTGVHTYSAYDAKAGSSSLTTKLYSSSPINNWGSGTSVYSSPYFNNPALPYFYGYNGKVYRVGDPWSRSYGLKFRYETRVTWHWFLKRRVNSKRVTLGPMETLDLGTNGNQPTSQACIEPTMRNVGKITTIYNDDSVLDQPQQYRYYMGYDASNQRNSNDSVFTTYSLAKKKHFPITGIMHVFKKFTRGIVNGYNKSWDGDVNWITIAGGAGMALVATLFGESILQWTNRIFSKLPGFINPLNSSGLWSAAGLTTAFLIVTALFIIWKLISFFSPKTHHYQENCKSFLHHFTNTPYIGTGDTLYRDDDLSIVNNGYYCDGVYYYRQQSNSINSKQLSFSNVFVEEDKPLQLAYSLPADSPTLVESWPKLVLLPYMSGKPLPYCGGSTIYYSQPLTHTVTVQCCNLEDCSEPVEINLPYGAVTSCISQADADNQAIAQFQAAIDYADDHSVYSVTINDEFIGQLDVNFTHEIKEEDNPTSVALFYDKRETSSVTTGTILYQDISGCQKAFPGYYSTPGDNYPKLYYKVENGTITSILTQSAASSTTTTTGQTIIKTDEDKSSNWYLKASSKQPLDTFLHNKNSRTFEAIDLLTTSEYTLSAGRIIRDTYTDGSFEKYGSYNTNGITSTTVTEQGTGWYAPIVPWKPESEDLFLYQNALISFTGGTRTTVIDGFGLTQLCEGSNTSNTYYHDGLNSLPSIGDRIFNTDTVNDPTPDGYIKYTSDLYMEIANGIMVQILSCGSSGEDDTPPVEPNTLNVTTTSAGFPPIFFAYVSNESTIIQTFTFTWKYVGQVSDINATVSYDGVTRSFGYTTPTISQTFSDGDALAFFVPFSLSGGNAVEAEFEFTLITASVDTVPTAPNNKTTVYVDHNG